MNYPTDAIYLLRAFAPVNQGGHLLIETWHRSEASKHVELLVLKDRSTRGEIGRVELVDLVTHVTTRVLP